jgi:hypothetical protein
MESAGCASCSTFLVADLFISPEMRDGLRTVAFVYGPVPSELYFDRVEA